MKLARYLSIFTLILIARVAVAATSIEVDLGWGEAFRIGRWNPVFVTLADAAPRAILLELYCDHAGNSTMLMRQRLSVGPVPATFALYAPLAQSADMLSIVIRDAQTERRIAEWPEDEQTRMQMLGNASTAQLLIGTSGRGPALRALEGNLTNAISVRPLDAARLPAVARGYDALVALVLNQPDFNRLTLEQQHAIVNWIRAGGRLIIWPGADAIPATSPLIDALPARIGENDTFAISPEFIKSAGLPPRFARLSGRRLAAGAAAGRVQLFAGDEALVGWRGRVGFGEILVLPIDPSLFTFNDAEAMKRFWQPLLEGIVSLKDPDNQSRYYWNDPVLVRHATAMTSVMDLLGDVPGIGRFGFGYVAAVLIGLMLIVGPVDWFVLRALGKQPWTWFTTTGWIVLITTAAIYVGYFFKSGELHFRTLRVTDQADGITVATTDMLGIYSPRTMLYEFSVDPESWWQPAGDARLGGRGGWRSDVRFRQDYQGNRPESMLINVWNLQFLEGETIAPAPATIGAKLKLGDNRLIGTLTNQSSHRLSDLRVVTKVGYCRIARPLEPGGSIDLDEPLVSSGDWKSGRTWQWYEFASERSERIDLLLRERSDLAVIYGEVDGAAPAVKISTPGAIEQHWRVVRALVPISSGTSSQ